MTLIDKLNEHKETIAVLRGTEEQGSHVFTFLGNYLLGLQDAIDIVKEHSDWISTSEQLPHAEGMLTIPYDPKEITGSDLCRAMLDKGWNLVPCVVKTTNPPLIY